MRQLGRSAHDAIVEPVGAGQLPRLRSMTPTMPTGRPLVVRPASLHPAVPQSDGMLMYDAGDRPPDRAPREPLF